MSLSDLVLSIADNKQMLGLRYAEWATRAPSLEADIAAAAMGLDDLGHSRVLYGCLEPLGADPRGPERESVASSLRALAYFDRPWSEWSEFVAANAILDTAFTAMIRDRSNDDGSTAVVRGRWKLINSDCNARDKAPTCVGRSGSNLELYDVRSDPDERSNLISTQPAVLDELRKLLLRSEDAASRSPFD